MSYTRFGIDNRSRTARRVIRRLDLRIAHEYRRQLACLPRDPHNYSLAADYMSALGILAHASALMQPLARAAIVDLQLTHQTLVRLSSALTAQIAARLSENPDACANLSRLLKGVLTADAAVASMLRSHCDRPIISRVLVSSDLLYQTHHMLFPAERMVVVAGRRSGTEVRLGAVFDVTGPTSPSAVHADPSLLARALIAMDRSGTYLAAWMHSHPGGGPMATWPSAIDRDQHQDWIRDYSSDLLSAIVVADGWVQLWGTALEQGRIAVEIVGEGIGREEDHDSLICLDQSGTS